MFYHERIYFISTSELVTAEPSSEGESDQAPGPYHQNYNTNLVSLLSYLDDTETVSLEEVCRLVLQVTAAADQEGMDSLAGAIVNNYYSKGGPAFSSLDDFGYSLNLIHVMRWNCVSDLDF